MAPGKAKKIGAELHRRKTPLVCARLIRFPASWAERAEAAREKEARLRAQLAAQRARDPARFMLPPVM